MNVLMYPIAPEDEFPDEFCAIRQGSGEHWFYVPEGESASWMLFRAESENAKLRELVRAAYNCTNAGPSCLECRIVAGGCTLLGAMRDLGVEVDG